MEPILAHVDDTSNNTMQPRAVDAVYLRPTGSLTRGFWAYDINTGERIHRHSATPTPLTKAMSKRIDVIAQKQKVPAGLIFGNSTGQTTILDLDTTPNTGDDDASDTFYQPDNDTGSIASDLSGVIDEETAIADSTIYENADNADDPTPQDVDVQDGA